MKYLTISGNENTLHIAICMRCNKRLNCSSMAQKYCSECRKIVDREKTLVRVRKFIEKQKIQSINAISG